MWPNRNEIVWEKVEELKQEYCYVAEDYHAELSIFQVLPFSFLEFNIYTLEQFCLLMLSFKVKLCDLCCWLCLIDM